MTHEQFTTKVGEMIGNLPKDIRLECDRLMRSGAIDLESYGDNYMAPKIVLFVALENITRGFRPLSDEAMEEARNLRHF
jgi:hypothetical protein